MVFRLGEQKLTRVPEEDFGQFFIAECYVIVHAYPVKHPGTASTEIGTPPGEKDLIEGQHKFVVYFYYGDGRYLRVRSKLNYKLFLSTRIREMVAKRSPFPPVEIDVEMKKEPVQFHRLFQGRLIHYLGRANNAKPPVRMYQVRGDSAVSATATQVSIPARCCVLSVLLRRSRWHRQR